MRNVIAAAATRPRHMPLTVIVALLGAVAFTAMAPSTARAGDLNHINEFDVSPSPFYYKREPPLNSVRTKTDHGSITLNVTRNAVAGGLCVMLLRAADGSRLALKCWRQNETVQSTWRLTNLPNASRSGRPGGGASAPR